VRNEQLSLDVDTKSRISRFCNESEQQNELLAFIKDDLKKTDDDKVKVLNLSYLRLTRILRKRFLERFQGFENTDKEFLKR
jgi:hypothetical protein